MERDCWGWWFAAARGYYWSVGWRYCSWSDATTMRTRVEGRAVGKIEAIAGRGFLVFCGGKRRKKNGGEENKVAVKGRRGDQGEAVSLNGGIFGLLVTWYRNEQPTAPFRLWTRQESTREPRPAI